MARRRFAIFRRATGEEPIEAAHVAVEDPETDEEDVEASGDTDETAAEPPAGTEEWETPAETPETAEARFVAEGDEEDEDTSANGGGAPSTADATDAAERIRIAAQRAAEQAEERAMDEILALEEDLARAKDRAAGQLKVIEGRLGEAERQASEAQRRAEDAELRAAEAEERIAEAERAHAAARAEAATRTGADQPGVDPQVRAAAEDQARAAAAGWLRNQLKTAREENEKQLAKAVEAARAETEQRVRAELAEAGELPEREAPTAAEVTATPPAELGEARSALDEARSELEREREEKARILEASDQRLREIEQQALAAAQRVETAERELAEEATRLREDAEGRIAEQTELARREATELVEGRMREKEAELERAKTELETERTQSATLLAEAERNLQEANDRVRAAEEAASQSAVEIRAAAANWLRTQTEALRKEGESRAIREAADGGRAPEPEAKEGPSAREDELIRKAAAAEDELAATRHQLEEASARAADAERRATEVELQARRAPGLGPEAPERPPEEKKRRSALRTPGVLRPAVPDPDPEDVVSLSSADYDELRGLGMSVTQAKRVIRYREERGGFGSVDELEELPGFPHTFLNQIRDRLGP